MNINFGYTTDDNNSNLSDYENQSEIQNIMGWRISSEDLTTIDSVDYSKDDKVSIFVDKMIVALFEKDRIKQIGRNQKKRMEDAFRSVAEMIKNNIKVIAEQRDEDLYIRRAEFLKLPMTFTKDGEVVVPLKKLGKLLGTGKHKKVKQALRIQLNPLQIEKSKIEAVASGTMEIRNIVMKRASQAEIEMARLIRRLHRTGQLNECIINVYTVTPYSKKSDPSIKKSAVIMEYCNGGDLKENLDTLSEQQKIQVALGVFKGLKALHAAGIFHSDIKEQNIFLIFDENKTLTGVKIGDFGCSVNMNGKGKKYFLSGDDKILPPEISNMRKRMFQKKIQFDERYLKAKNNFEKFKKTNKKDACLKEFMKVKSTLVDDYRSEYYEIDETIFKADMYSAGLLLEKLFPDVESPDGLDRLVNRLKDRRPAKRPLADEAYEFMQGIEEEHSLKNPQDNKKRKTTCKIPRNSVENLEYDARGYPIFDNPEL